MTSRNSSHRASYKQRDKESTSFSVYVDSRRQEPERLGEEVAGNDDGVVAMK